MTPQELKNSILQLAIQGKLVEQRPEEGTAAELLVDITIDDRVDGQRVKEKEITAISESDISFDLPDSWEWIKLGSVCTIARGGSPRPIKDYITDAEDGVNWIKIGDTEKNGKYISSTAEKIKLSGVPKSRVVHVGDFLLTNSMSFGRPYILKIDGCIHDGWLVISQSAEVFDQDYLYWLLSSGYAYSQFCGKVSGAVVKNLNSDKVANSVFPLPPLAEQKRIVAKIEELLPLIDRYEQAWSRLEDFNKRFPGDMQKSILQMAIQGKLVEQRPEEGTGEELYAQIQAEKQALIKAGKIKKEKPLPPIKEDEKPFDIPESWKWVKLSGITTKITDGTHHSPPNTDAGDYMYVTAKNIKDSGINLDQITFVSKETHEEIYSRCNPEKGDVLLIKDGATTGVVTVNNLPQPFSLLSSVALIKLPSSVYAWYLVFVLRSELFYRAIRQQMKGTGITRITLKQIEPLLVPLPPLAEQKRIVARLEELLPLCERLR